MYSIFSLIVAPIIVGLVLKLVSLWLEKKSDK
ncbi:MULTISPECIES: type I toxin-antitoxin system Fst family toxin [unclassified Listeria]|nr:MULTISPECIES: type I toxin-antitoxin system Fst family toxin [unclassified Listeria]